MISLKIRDEEQADWKAVYALNASAFESTAEARLVDELRRTADPFVSLVAEDNGKIVGHIMFTPVTLEGDSAAVLMGLAPMAVAPERQREGIGSQLVRAGLERCRKLDFGAVVVLGHPDYYPRFGFLPATRFGIGCEYDAPEEAFMALELEPGYLSHRSGIIRFNEAFRNA